MQEIRSSNPPVVTRICDPNKSRARHHRNNKKATSHNDHYMKNMGSQWPKIGAN